MLGKKKFTAKAEFHLSGIRITASTNVEMVVLLSHKSPDSHMMYKWNLEKSRGKCLWMQLQRWKGL